jgi:pilus assembly protein CpaC
VKPAIAIACLSALSIGIFAEPALQAQTSAPLSQSATGSSQDSANDLSVAVGRSVLVDCARPIARVSIGLGDFAEATAITPTEILVNGKAPGETSLIIWDTTGGRQFFNLTVRPSATVSNDGLEAIRREFRTELPGQTLKISSENGMLFLRGTVKDLTSSARAVEIAASAGKVVNLLNVNVPPADPQILLKVRFASVDRVKSKSLGLNLVSLGAGNTVGSITTGQFNPPIVTNGPPASAVFTNPFNLLVEGPGNLPFGFDIQALESKGVVEILAEPNLLAANGKQASFLAGGEYPYPVVQGGSGGAGASVTILFKEYGVRLGFIPTITPRGTIRLQVAPEVSSLDFSNAVEVSGFNVPAIATRKVKTEVELNDGQSFVIGGLLDNRETETFQKIPFLGDIPVLGKFFQSISKNRTNTELIVIVTVEIVAPIPAGAPLPNLNYPEKFLPPNSAIPMHTPDAKTAADTPAAPQATMPVEKLIDSMKAEHPLAGDGVQGGMDSLSGGSSTSTVPTPAPAPAPQ